MPKNLAELLDEILALAKQASSFLVQLGPLTLSADEAVIGEPVSTTIIGATTGGRVSCSPPDGMTFDPVTLTIVGTPTTIGKYDITLRETHPQGSNSPRLSVVRFTVTAKPVDVVPYGWGDPRLAWGQAGVTWGQLLPAGGTTPQDFWSGPFWTRSNFWGD